VRSLVTAHVDAARPRANDVRFGSLCERDGTSFGAGGSLNRSGGDLVPQCPFRVGAISQ